MAGKIFINYRRGDDPGFAGRRFDWLSKAFGSEQVFMDVEGHIKPGQDFVRVLNEQVADCDLILVVIGREWLNARDDQWQRRLDNPHDFVRIEIESALRLGKLVIPVLVNDAQMPGASALPESLRPLASRHAVRLTHDRFAIDAQGLVDKLQEELKEIPRLEHS
jgi:TIR domain